ncbi:Tyrosine recombinase XerD [compost metagenome]
MANQAPQDVLLDTVLTRYLSQHGADLPSKDSAKRGAALWREWWKPSDTVADITIGRQEDFLAWMLGKGYSEGYARRILGVGKSALNRAWKRGEIAQVPFVELPPIGEAYPHYATREQVVRLLNTPMPEHIWAMLLIRLCTGCRGDAAHDLQAFQIDKRAGLIRLNPPGRKQTKKYRPVVPLLPVLDAYLERAKPSAYVVNWHGKRVASVKTTWRKIRKAAALPVWFVPKTIRHTVATWLRQRGVPAWEVSGLLGHHAGGTTDAYAKFDPAYLGEARKALIEILADLAKDVPRLSELIGVSVGSVDPQTPSIESTESAATSRLKVVGGTGFEPVTPTMSR